MDREGMKESDGMDCSVDDNVGCLASALDWCGDEFVKKCLMDIVDAGEIERLRNFVAGYDGPSCIKG